MKIEHKTTPIEHWIVDGKAYRLATESDVGKEVYFDDFGIELAFSDPHRKTLTKITKSGKESRFYSGIGWRFAYIQDNSLLTPQRTPVPALGEGWYLLTAEDGEFIKGDSGTAGGIDSGWVDASLLAGQQVSVWLGRGCLAARYFGPASSEPQVIQTKDTHDTPKSIDWTKPVRTKDGRAVRVLCTDGPGDYPVVGIVDDTAIPQTWTLDGCFWVKELSECYLENVPGRIQREYWVNVYRDEACNAIHATPDEANRCADDDRIACVKITIDCEEGEGL